MKPSINLRYKSLLLTCLLIFSAGVAVPAWGQTYTINYKNGSPQTGITERVDTVYVADGEERELFIPELRNNDGVSDPYYRWYDHRQHIFLFYFFSFSAIQFSDFLSFNAENSSRSTFSWTVPVTAPIGFPLSNAMKDGTFSIPY